MLALRQVLLLEQHLQLQLHLPRELELEQVNARETSLSKQPPQRKVDEAVQLALVVQPAQELELEPEQEAQPAPSAATAKKARRRSSTWATLP